MKFKQIVLGLGLLLFLAACQNQNIWIKPNPGPGEFDRDRFACLQQSQQQFTQGQVNGGGGYVNGTVSAGSETNGVLFDACMKSKGWSLQNKKQFEEKSQQNAQRWADVNARSAALQSARCADGANKAYYAKTACKAQEITVGQMADTSKISTAEKEIFLKIEEQLAPIRAEAVSALRQFNNPNDTKNAEVYQRLIIKGSDENSLKLLSGEITWGEYNRRRKQLTEDYATERFKIYGK